MQQGLAGILPLVVALLMGIVGGAVLVNMLLGARIRSLLPDGSHSSPVESMGLNKLVPSEVPEVAAGPDRVQALEAKLATSEGQLKASETKCAELTDKCAQLEDKFAQSEEKFAKLQETSKQPDGNESKVPDLESEHASKVSALEAEQASKVSLLETEHASKVSSLEKEIASLQERIKKEAEEQTAALAAKASRVTELEQKQKDDAEEIESLKQAAKDDSDEIERLKKTVADSREKWEASVSHIEEQQKAIDRIEAEKSELFTKRDQLLQEHEGLRANLSELNGLLDAEREQTAEKLVLLERAKEQLSNTFKCLASEMVEEKVAG